MSQPALEQSATQYAQYWLRSERSFVEALADSDEEGHLAAIQRAAGYFRIARNFPKAFDIGSGLARLAPVRDLLLPPTRRPPDAEALRQAVESFRRELGALY